MNINHRVITPSITLIIISTIISIVSIRQTSSQDYYYPPVYPPYSAYPPPPVAPNIALGFGTLPFQVSPQCDHKVLSNPEYQKCRTEAIVNWGTNVDATDKIKYRCCYYWDLVDCFESAIHESCTRNEHAFEDSYRTFAVRKEEMIAGHRYSCVDYEYGSIKCWFYWWVIAIIIIGAFVVILVVACVCYRFCRNRKKVDDKNTTVKTKAVHVKTTAF